MGSPTLASRQPHCRELGKAIGVWLRGYHGWSVEHSGLSELLAPVDQPPKVVRMVHFAWIPDRIVKREIAKLGAELMTPAYKKDSGWFDESELACLFFCVKV